MRADVLVDCGVGWRFGGGIRAVVLVAETAEFGSRECELKDCCVCTET